jgi:pentatricopeptide repeat protein
MRKNRVTPTNITLGCMVEALTSNGETDASYELLQEMLSDPECKPLVNAVIYGTVLKGFSHKKRFDQVWSIYQEMLELKLQFSIVTFNTILDACARSGEMTHIPALLESMEKQNIQPNLITYGIVIKGYCQENRLTEALQVWETMLSTTKYQPDEIMYNTILDGCARKGLYERGMTLLAEMRTSGIRPTNFTLSVLVKLASRANLLEKCFDICREISQAYQFHLNVHVFNNLIQACITHKQLQRSFDVLDRMVRERVRPDLRTYTLLLKACVAAQQASDADGLIRAAFGLQDAHPKLAHATSFARLQKGLPSDLLAEVLEGMSQQCQQNALAITLLKDLKTLPHVKLPAQFQLRLTNQAMRRR